jgi:hypothetical protein
VDKTTGVRSDHTVILTSFESASVYPDAFRRVTYLDVETKKRFKFLTNNFTLPAHVIAQIDKLGGTTRASAAEHSCSIFRIGESVARFAKPQQRGTRRGAYATFIGLPLAMLEVSCYGTTTRG